MEPTRQHEPGFRLLPLGDAAVTVEFGSEISPGLNERVLRFADHVQAHAWPGVLDVVPAYCSVVIHVDPLRLDVSALRDRLLSLSDTAPSACRRSPRTHRIPVLYGGESGPDLEEVARHANLSVADVIRLHASGPYRVYMLGFSPGFPYLGLVPPAIAIPRLATPRMAVPAGSVGIAERQTGVYPVPTPAGWRVIGRTPISIYRPHASDPFLLHPGDTVRFEPIRRDEFTRLSRTA
ncbi:MAG TPA: 5-oxoprolinase subunit PxpB [Nitrospira sp.]|nr:5-oxoprolinase subunit PxpB [Nitrospira sp.]